jgi:hypothetical protein
LIALTICLVTGVIAFLISLFSKSFYPARIWKIVFVAFVLVGIISIFKESREIDFSFELRKWPTTAATITSAEIAGIRAFHPIIKYEYELAGVKHTDSTDMDLPGFGNKRTRYSNSEKIIKEYPAGTVLTIHYNPENPSISRVHINAEYSSYLILTTGVMLYGIGFFGLVTQGIQFFRKRVG